MLPEKPQNWSFTLAGSTGTVDVETTVESGNLQKVVDDINAHAPATGVTASIDADSKTIVLRDSEAGNISISGIQIKGQDGADSEVLSKLEFTPIDESGKSVGNTRSLADVDQLLGTNLENMRSAMDHLSLQQTRLGAYGSKAAIQIEALTNRTMVITKDISKINDADLAQLVTTLQAQLTNRDAAQQAFAKIGQQSLFDFIR